MATRNICRADFTRRAIVLSAKPCPFIHCRHLSAPAGPTSPSETAAPKYSSSTRSVCRYVVAVPGFTWTEAKKSVRNVPSVTNDRFRGRTRLAVASLP